MLSVLFIFLRTGAYLHHVKSTVQLKLFIGQRYSVSETCQTVPSRAIVSKEGHNVIVVSNFFVKSIKIAKSLDIIHLRALFFFYINNDNNLHAYYVHGMVFGLKNNGKKIQFSGSY